MAEESTSEQQAIIDASLRKYPELAVPELTIRYERLLDEHPFYAGVAASTLSTEQGTTVLVSSLGLGQSRRNWHSRFCMRPTMSAIQKTRALVKKRGQRNSLMLGGKQYKHVMRGMCDGSIQH